MIKISTGIYWFKYNTRRICQKCGFIDTVSETEFKFPPNLWRLLSHFLNLFSPSASSGEQTPKRLLTQTIQLCLSWQPVYEKEYSEFRHVGLAKSCRKDIDTTKTTAALLVRLWPQTPQERSMVWHRHRMLIKIQFSKIFLIIILSRF